MTTKDFNSRIKAIRTKAIENVDKSFIEYIKEDILECGQVEYLIGDEDWSFYWQDISIECKEIIDELIDVQASISSTSFNELMNQCIEVKIIADQKIYEIEEDNIDIVIKEMGITTSFSSYQDIIQILGSDEVKDLRIETLFKELKSLTLIDCTPQNFNAHFNKVTEFPKRIQWLGTEKQIVGLFSLLIDNSIFPLSYRKKYLKLIEKHFLNKNGESFKSKQLTVVRSSLDMSELIELARITNLLAQIKLN